MVNKAETLSNLGGIPKEVTALRETRKADGSLVQPLTNRITELNGRLSTLWQLKTNGEISLKDYKERQQELASQLHQIERQRGHKPVRTKRV